jgi:hypothetical protein
MNSHPLRTIKSIVFLALFATLPLRAQQNSSVQTSDLVTVGNEKFLRWYGYDGRSYFVQVSDPGDPLAKWKWAPIIEGGNDEDISFEVDGTAEKAFFRLKYTDLPVPSGETLDTADFDNDGISNIDEIAPPHRC